MGPDSKNTGCKRSRNEKTGKVKQGHKRSRHGMMKADSQAKTSTNAALQEDNKSGYGLTQVNNFVTTGHGNDHMGSLRYWDCDYGDMELDIQVIFSEYGDFSDFFENDDLLFGEPPGASDMQAPLDSAQDCGSKRSRLMNLKNVSVQMLLPVPTMQSNSMNLNNSSNQATPHISSTKSKNASYQTCPQAQLSRPQDFVTTRSSFLNLTNFSDQKLMQNPLYSASNFGSISSSSLDFMNVTGQTFQSPSFPHFHNSKQPAASATKNLLSSNQQATSNSVGFLPTIRDLNLTNFSSQMRMQNPRCFAPDYENISSSLLDLTNVSGQIFQSPSFPHFQNCEQPTASATENHLSSNQQATYNTAGLAPTNHVATSSNGHEIIDVEEYCTNMERRERLKNSFLGKIPSTIDRQMEAAAMMKYVQGFGAVETPSANYVPDTTPPYPLAHGTIDMQEYYANMERQERLINIARMRIINSTQQQEMSWYSDPSPHLSGVSYQNERTRSNLSSFLGTFV